MKFSRRHIEPTHLQPRILGAYLVIPGNSLLRAVRRPAQRMQIALRILEAVRAAESRVLAVIDDAAIELHDKHDVSWSAISRATGIPAETIRDRVYARRRMLNPAAYLPHRERSTANAA